MEATFPHESLIDQHMIDMEKDLGCFDAIKVQTADLSSSTHINGILFVWSDITGGGCWSALGKAPGFTGGLGSITKWNAPATWQIISLDSGCGGSTAATVMHEGQCH